MTNTPPIRAFVEDDSATCPSGDANALRIGDSEDPQSPSQAQPVQYLKENAVSENVVRENAATDNAVTEIAREQTTAARALRDSQRLISIGRLSAEIVHEINNPLESVGNLLYLALHEPGLPPTATAFLRSAESELQRVVQISRQTLSFSRESTEPVAIRPVDLMDEVVRMYSRRMMQKQLVLAEDYKSIRTIVAIPGEIRQILSNLVTNAIEASFNGGKLLLRMRDTRRWKAGTRQNGVTIVICDHGSGIEEAARKRLGEIFFTTKGESGPGLGLWVTNTIVSRYGGTMRFRSSTGPVHGTVFSIFLPSDSPSSKLGKLDLPVSRTAEKVTEISRHPRHTTNQQGGTQDGTKDESYLQRRG